MTGVVEGSFGGPDVEVAEPAVVLAAAAVLPTVVVAALFVLAVAAVVRRRRAAGDLPVGAQGRSAEDDPDGSWFPDVLPAARRVRVGIRGRLRRIGERRLATWRGRRRAEAAAAGVPFDPFEPPPWHVAVWGLGDGAAQMAAERFRALRDLHPEVEGLHHRRLPRRAGAILDHLFVGPAGVVVAGSHRWSGFVEVVGDRLLVAGRDRSAAADAIGRRVIAVRQVLAAAGFAGVPVHGVLHCVETEDVLLDGSLRLRDVVLLDAIGTLGRAVDDPVLSYEGVRAVAVAVERGLPPA